MKLMNPWQMRFVMLNNFDYKLFYSKQKNKLIFISK